MFCAIIVPLYPLDFYGFRRLDFRRSGKLFGFNLQKCKKY